MKPQKPGRNNKDAHTNGCELFTPVHVLLVHSSELCDELCDVCWFICLRVSCLCLFLCGFLFVFLVCVVVGTDLLPALLAPIEARGLSYLYETSIREYFQFAGKAYINTKLAPHTFGELTAHIMNVPRADLHTR